MKATIFEDRMGNLHVFKGHIDLDTSTNILPTHLGNEADLFVQSQSDRLAILDSLPLNNTADICRGYTTWVDDLDDLYFGS